MADAIGQMLQETSMVAVKHNSHMHNTPEYRRDKLLIIYVTTL